MIYTGLSRLYVSKYSYDKLLNKASYSDGISLGEAMDYVINITTASTPLYTNNRKRGEIVSFSDGSVTHKAPDSNMEASAYISGITPKEITIAEGKTVKKYGRSVEIQPPYLGFGTVYQVYDADANKYRYQPIITPKIQYQLSSNNVNTQGETITFNVPDLPAKVMVDDETKEWLWEYDLYDTEEEADEVLRLILKVAPKTESGDTGAETV